MMLRRILLAALLLAPIEAQAQLAVIAPTVTSPTDNSDRLATTAWVNNFVNAGLPLASGKIWIGSAGGIATAQSPSGDWTISNSGVATLATVNANVGSFGSVTNCPTATVNAKGLITAISAATCTPAIGSVTGLGSGVATALGTAVGSAGGPVTNGGALGTPSSGAATNLSGTAASLTAGHVTTNANLTGDVTSVGNASTYANVVPAAKGGAGTINGVLSANGAGLVSQAATTGLSDVTAPTTWTPSDQSGAALTFTSVTALYTKIGKLVVAQFRLTFPSTASSAQVSIGGLPVASSSSGASFAAGTCISTASGNAIVNAVVPAGGTTMTLFNTSATDPTNATMTTATLTCSFSYISN